MRDRIRQIQEVLHDRADTPKVEVPAEKPGDGDNGNPSLH